MECPNCGNDEVEIFMAEPIECVHCDKTTYIEYVRCEECSSVFKAVGGKVDDKSTMSLPDNFVSTIDDIMSVLFSASHDVLDEEQFKEMIETMGDDVEVKEIKVGFGQESMTDVIHKCLNCNAVAYEISQGKFACPDCDFTWEVVNCG
jgi:phosphosulfolactate synthase (CoM biosynthesis protein A)